VSDRLLPLFTSARIGGKLRWFTRRGRTLWLGLTVSVGLRPTVSDALGVYFRWRWAMGGVWSDEHRTLEF
jgi:hypothetical protein